MKCPNCGKNKEKILCYDCWSKSDETKKKEFMKNYTLGFSGGIAVFLATLAYDKLLTNVSNLPPEQILLRGLVSLVFFVTAFFLVGGLGYIMLKACER